MPHPLLDPPAQGGYSVGDRDGIQSRPMRAAGGGRGGEQRKKHLYGQSTDLAADL
jgi:hypothetical protein